MTRGQVVRMILAEAALMGIIGGVLGLVFGVILSRIFLLAMTAMSGYSLEFILPLQRILLAVVMAFVISQVAACCRLPGQPEPASSRQFTTNDR